MDISTLSFDHHRLSEAELVYELTVRGEKLLGNEKVVVLRGIFKGVKDKDTISETKFKKSEYIDTELATIKEAINKLDEDIQTLPNEQIDIRTLETKLTHYVNRLNRVQLGSDEQNTNKKDLLETLDHTLGTYITHKTSNKSLKSAPPSTFTPPVPPSPPPLLLPTTSFTSAHLTQSLPTTPSKSAHLTQLLPPPLIPTTPSKLAHLTQSLLPSHNHRTDPDVDTRRNRVYTTPNIGIQTPKIVPPTFEGKGANVDDFIEEYNLATDLNNWDGEQKIRFLPYYLKGPARVLFQNEKHNIHSWSAVENLLRANYHMVGHTEALEYEMYNKGQELNESVGEFIQNKIKLIDKVNPQMSEGGKAKLILLGLLPDLAARVASMPGNQTLAGLKENIRITEFANYVTDRSIRRVRDSSLAQGSNLMCNTMRTREDEILTRLEKIELGLSRQAVPNHVNHVINKTLPSNNFSYSTGIHQRPNNAQGRSGDGRPICFNCNRIGHVARHCRECQQHQRRAPPAKLAGNDQVARERGILGPQI
uniref:CCHC-type domain-containing protein n=1 Tax=Cacopsylla melanoneura TaxID=428564 RepID=A0A8D8U434_9HEMI